MNCNVIINAITYVDKKRLLQNIHAHKHSAEYIHMHINYAPIILTVKDPSTFERTPRYPNVELNICRHIV